jgi:hypothetical protein
MERRRPDRERGPQFMLDRLSGRMAQTLELTEEQQVEFDAIVEEFRQRMNEGAAGPGERRRLREEMREARDSGDDAQADELRGQMREQRHGSQALMEEFFDRVEPILEGDQVERLTEMRERFAERGRRGDRRAGMQQLIEQIPGKLELDEEQQAQYDELVAGLRSGAEERRARWQEMQPLMQELREARRAGDEQRVAEIRSQLDEARGAGGSPLEAFFADLEEILRDDQKAKLAELREAAGDRRGPRGTQDVPAIIRAAKRLDLNEEQRGSLREISEKAARDWRELGRRDRAARVELARRVKQDIVGILTPEQAEQFEQVLQRERPGRGPQGREGPHRGRRGGRMGGERP